MDFDGFVVGDWNAHGQVAGLHQHHCPRRSTPGSTCSWRPTAGRACTTTRCAQVQSGADPDGAARRRGAAHPAGEVARAACSTRARPRRGRSAGNSSCSARPSIARSRARRCASRWCCSRTTGQSLPLSAQGQRAGRGRRRRQHPQAVGRLDDHLAGHRAQQRRLPACASRSGAAIDEAVTARPAARRS